MNLDYDLSMKVAKQIGAKLGQCYKNAFNTLPLVNPGALYVQGLATSHKLSFIPLDHGWVEVNGKIVDPTWVDMIDVQYWPIQKWTWDEVLTQLENQKQMSLPLIMVSVQQNEYVDHIMKFIDKLNGKD